MRAWTTSAREVVPGPGARSTTRTLTPKRVSQSASVSPVGPAPTMSTSAMGTLCENRPMSLAQAPRIGLLECGARDAITDVPGVKVGHFTLAQGDVQTGV